MFIQKKKYNDLCKKNHDLENELVREVARGEKNNTFYKSAIAASDSAYKDMLKGYEELENKIASLETELSVKKLKNEQLEDDIKSTNEAYNKLLSTNNQICKDYNRINNKLWCNNESVRQLDKFADVILENDMKVKDIASYARQIAFYLKGGENKVYTTSDCDLKGECDNE